MQTDWWQTEHRRVDTSYLTGREVITNTDSTRFLILTERYSGEAFRRSIKDWTVRWQDMKRGRYPSSHLRSVVAAALDQAKRWDGIGALLNDLFAANARWAAQGQSCLPWSRTDKARIRDLLLACYREDLLVFPSARSKLFLGTRFLLDDFGPIGYLGKQWIGATKTKAADAAPFIIRLLLTRAGARSIGDLVPAVIGDDFRKTPSGLALARGLWLAQRVDHQSALMHNPDDFGPFGKDAARGRNGTDFQWAVRQDPSLGAWCSLAAGFLATRDSAKEGWTTALNGFIDHLVAHLALPREPASYLDRRVKPQPLFEHSNPLAHNYVVSFLNWVLDVHFSEEDENGAVVSLRGFANPLLKKGSKPKPAETGREAMPIRLVRLALEILTENDWAWAKAQETDFVHCWSPDAQEWERCWCPARALVLYIALRMPFRVSQVRMSDSGEADTMAYDVQTRIMVPNTGPLRSGSPTKSVQKGVLQVLPGSKDGSGITVLRLSTNKTADTGKKGWQKGYDCPYAPEDVIATLAWLRDWQAQYNPISGPSEWVDVRELTDTKPANDLAGQRSCFLFRDPCSHRPAEPVTHGRVWQLWVQLLAELEVRLEKEGITGADGEKLLLVRKWSRGRPTCVVYDLHTLRVTMITAFYEDGRVPAEVLMKIVGHSTVAMTLYYAKLGAAFVADEMGLAAARVQEVEKANWLRFQRARSTETLRRAVTWNDDAGLSAFSTGTSASFQLMNVGLCPVGCSMCDRGGKRVEGTGRRVLHHAVPGGRTNCAECRFLISGPPFRPGIQAEFNARSLALAKLSRERDTLETAFEILDAERRSCANKGTPFLRHREWMRASNDLDDLTAQVDQVARAMQNLAALDAQIEHLSNREENRVCEQSLVVGDLVSVQSAFEETTEFDVADRVCHSTLMFPSIVSADANRLRMRKYDQMLRRNGLQPVFLDMDEATALRAGNRLSELLAKLAGGRPAALRLVEGQETLARLGILPRELVSKPHDLVGQRLAHIGGSDAA